MTAIVQEAERLVGAYACPEGFVSQVVYFSPKPNLKWFKDFLSEQVGEGNLSQRDVRTATRHGWELGGNASKVLEEKLGHSGSITEVYWTRYPRSEEQKQLAVSLCTGHDSKKGCMRLFVHDSQIADKFCPACQGKYGLSKA